MAIKSITTTELKYACLDSDWRNQWIAGKKPQTNPMHPAGSIAVYGIKFHKIVRNFLDWLIANNDEKISTNLNDKYAIWNEMYNRFAICEINKILKDNKIDSAYYLGNALKAFCNCLAKLRKDTNNFNSWKQIFLTNEFLVKDIEFKVDDSSIFVSGQLDTIRKHPSRGLEVVDYKLTQGDNFKHDLLQLAIYTKLLSNIKPEIKFSGVIEYYTPELNEVVVTNKELTSLFEDIVLPVIYELAEDKNGEFPNDKQVCKNENRVDDLSEKIESVYSGFGLNIKIVEKQEAPQLIRYKVIPDSGVKVISLSNRNKDLQVALSLKSPPMIESSKGFVAIDIPREKPDTFYWKNIKKEIWDIVDKKPVSFPIGIGVDNNIILGDFADPNMCHVLIAGSSGSGKSEFLKSMVSSLIKNNTTKTLKLTIIDPKILTFNSISNCKFLTEPIITEVSKAIKCLESIEKEMETRYKNLAQEEFEDLNSRISAGKDDIPFHVVFVDEFADLILQGKKEKEAFERVVARLAAKGRAAGIHLVLATQRPDKNIVTGIIKSNLPLKICLKVTSAINSKIVLDHTGGELLCGMGDLICDRGHGLERGQAPYISQNELLEIAGIKKKGVYPSFKIKFRFRLWLK